MSNERQGIFAGCAPDDKECDVQRGEYVGHFFVDFHCIEGFLERMHEVEDKD